MLKKTICTLLCLLLLTSCAASPAQTPAPAETQTQTPAETDEAPAAGFYTEDSPEYRDLYSNNAIEQALDSAFADAVTVEDFEALSETYLTAWRDEYHALMAQLIESDAGAADELRGLLEYTDELAQETYNTTFAMHTYTDEDGNEQPAAGAGQNANFDAAEVYKNATVLSILNDYHGETPYVFHYTAQ